MTETPEIEQVNGHGPIVAGAAGTVPGQRAPADEPQDAPLRELDDEDGPQDYLPDELDEDDDLGEPVDLRGLLPEQIRAPHRFAVRHTRHIAVGARVYASRRRDARCTARHERMMRIAETNGDHASALEWETRAAAFRKERHSRRMALLRAPIYAAKAAVNLAALAVGALIALGLILAVTSGNPHEAGVPLHVAFRVVWWICWAVDIGWRPALAACPVLILAGLWTLGRAHSPLEPTLYAEDGEGDGRELVPDESAIIAALRNLGLAKFNAAVKAGWRPRWLTLPHLDGNGWRAQLLLPQGTNVEAINAPKIKNLLASNLMRKPIEVWATEPENRPGVLDLWVANPRRADRRGTALAAADDRDLRLLQDGPGRGVAARRTDHGAAVPEELHVGGIMGTGKSSVTRCLLLGADARSAGRHRRVLMADNSDYDPMRSRLRTLVKGDDDEQIEAALNDAAPAAQRGHDPRAATREYGELKVTRELARRNKRLRPLVCVLDEVHELFEHKEYGEEAAELAIKVLKKARKCAITLVFVTVSPTATSIPKEITRNTSNRVAFAVGDHIANDGLLGTGKHSAGVTATKLNPSTDIGTAVTSGSARSRSTSPGCRLQPGGDEQVTAVLSRALKAFGGEQVAALDPEPAEDAFDPIEDIAEILGDAPRMRTQEVLERLRALRPAEYREMDFPKLTGVLRDAGAEPHKSSGISTVDRGKVHAALADRAEGEPGEGDDAVEDEPYGDEIE